MRIKVSVRHGGGRQSPVFVATTWIGLRKFRGSGPTETDAVAMLRYKMALFHASAALDRTYPKTLEEE